MVVLVLVFDTDPKIGLQCRLHSLLLVFEGPNYKVLDSCFVAVLTRRKVIPILLSVVDGNHYACCWLLVEERYLVEESNPS